MAVKSFKFNPFGFILEHTKSPYAPHTRTLRTKLSYKFFDTFFVCCGSFEKIADAKGPNDKNYRLGLLDYLFLGLPFLVIKLVPATENSKILRPILIGIFLLLSAIKALIAAVLTLIVSPFVLLTHAIARLVAGKEVDEALKAEVNDGFESADIKKPLSSLSGNLEEVTCLLARGNISLSAGGNKADLILDKAVPSLHKLNFFGLAENEEVSKFIANIDFSSR